MNKGRVKIKGLRVGLGEFTPGLLSHGKDILLQYVGSHPRVLSSRHYPVCLRKITQSAVWRLDRKGAKVSWRSQGKLLLIQMREKE